MAAFNVPVFPIPESPYHDLIEGILNSYQATKYGFPKAAAELETEKLKPQQIRSEIDLRKAQADKANAIMGLITEYLGGGKGQGGGGQKSSAISQENGNLFNIGSQSSIPSSNESQISSNANIPQSQQGISSNKDLAKESFISHLLGFGSNQIMDINGTKYALTGTGKLFPVAQGLSPSEKAFQESMGKYRGEAFGKASESVRGLQNQSLALDEMINAVSNDPEFYNVTGPVQSYFIKWAGNPAQQQLLGTLQTQSGEISLQIAPSLKGAFTGRDQTLLGEIKANPKTDMPDIFIGKLKAQKLINSVLEERQDLAAQYIKQGDDPLTANKKAARQTPLEKYRTIVDKLVDPIVTIRNQKGEEKEVRLSEARKLKAKGAS